jgi:[ribosomal protein S5]-alanine N-acetyltransferase
MRSLDRQGAEFASTGSADLRLDGWYSRPPLRPHHPVIATSHLRLRSFEPSDISRLVTIANQHDVTDTTIELPRPFTAEHARQWIEFHPASWAACQALHWAVSLLSDGRLVGYVGLHDIDLQDRQAEIDLRMASCSNRASLAMEAGQAALAFAFTTLQMNHVCAFHLARNSFAAHALTDIGMQQQTYLRQRTNKRDSLEEVVVRGLSRSDWLKSL